jgi:hypothetical protein
MPTRHAVVSEEQNPENPLWNGCSKANLLAFVCVRRPWAQGRNQVTKPWEAAAKDVLSKEKKHCVGLLPLPQLNHNKVYDKYTALKKY